MKTFNFLPGHVTFRDMPASRWWDFEDGVTDFGALTPDKVDSESVWSLFKLTGAGARSPYLLMPPRLGVVMEGEPLEDVLFLRDDMAAMAWAVEHRLQGPMDTPLDALQLAFEHDAAFREPPPPVQVPGCPNRPTCWRRPCPTTGFRWCLS